MTGFEVALIASHVQTMIPRTASIRHRAIVMPSAKQRDCGVVGDLAWSSVAYDLSCSRRHRRRWFGFFGDSQSAQHAKKPKSAEEDVITQLNCDLGNFLGRAQCGATIDELSACLNLGQRFRHESQGLLPVTSCSLLQHG